jgi:cytochrome c oxidase cbb3-type subunit I/II
MSIRSVNALAHDTDWVIGHVHGGALGWNGFMAAGMFYWLVPRLYGKKLHSERAANFHFWAGLVGILMYMTAMYVSGITQGLMWRALTEEGTLLYPNFLESIFASRNMYILRAAGGGLYLATFILMAWNLVKTARAGAPVEVTASVAVEAPEPEAVPTKRLVLGPVLALTVIGFLLVMALGVPSRDLGITMIVALILFGLIVRHLRKEGVGTYGGQTWHELLEGRAFLFTVLSLIAILIGGMVQILPLVLSKAALPMERTPTRYTALELAGRRVYRREGCYVCHTQMIRPLVAETLRYGKPSEAWESRYDHPFQWGSKRTGPDLARVGGKYPDLWHWRHLEDPRSTSQGSIMPSYAFLAKQPVDREQIPRVMRVMQKLGVPYTDAEVASASADAKAQAERIAAGLKSAGASADPSSDAVALTAYLQRLGIENK